MVEFCIPKTPMFFFFDFNVFWRENDASRLTAKLRFQDIAKQIKNFKKAERDRIECEFFFSKTQLVKDL